MNYPYTQSIHSKTSRKWRDHFLMAHTDDPLTEKPRCCIFIQHIGAKGYALLVVCPGFKWPSLQTQNKKTYTWVACLTFPCFLGSQWHIYSDGHDPDVTTPCFGADQLRMWLRTPEQHICRLYHPTQRLLQSIRALSILPQQPFKNRRSPLCDKKAHNIICSGACIIGFIRMHYLIDSSVKVRNKGGV